MTPKPVVFLDLWTDTNRGDEVLQCSLIELIRAAYPTRNLIGIYRFGFNEYKEARLEISATEQLLDEAIPGPRVTRYARNAPLTKRWIPSGWYTATSILVVLVRLYTYKAAPRLWRRRWSGAPYRVFAALECAHVVVWKGKNFREYRGVTTLTRALTLTISCFVASRLNRNIICVNASVWPIANHLARLWYRMIFGFCEHVVCREMESVTNLRKLSLPNRTQIRYAPDLSFRFAGNELYKTLQCHSDSEARRYDVALTLTIWGTRVDQSRYVDSLAHAIRHLHGFGVTSLVVVPQVVRIAEDNSPVVEQLRTRCSDLPDLHFTILPDPGTAAALVDVYRNSRMLIGTRLHSCVFARAANTPFIAIAYDAGSKWDILRSFWPSRYIVNYFDLEAAGLAELSANMWTHREEAIAESAIQFQELCANVALNVMPG